MRSERSQQTSLSGRPFPGLGLERGILFVVGVPIGHPDDITLRALATLRNVGIVASEDPQATQALLQRHDIHTQVTSYGPVDLREKVKVLIQKLQEGAHIALVSDCGSPVISDPGSRLITAAHTHAIRVCSVPGPSAVTAAVAAAGLPDESWVFGGQLPEGRTALTRRLIRILEYTQFTLLFCTDKSLIASLAVLASQAPKRHLRLVYNLTLSDERMVRGNSTQIRRMLQSQRLSGASTLIVIGRKRPRKRNPVKKRRSS